MQYNKINKRPRKLEHDKTTQQEKDPKKAREIHINAETHVCVYRYPIKLPNRKP